MRQLLTIPVYNEEATLRKVVDETLPYLVAPLTDLLLINDGSSDGSRAIIDELAAKHEHISALHHEPNRGYGGTMRSAMEAAREGGYEFVITMDCDHQHEPEDLARFVNFDPTVDVVSGSRYMPESGRSGDAPGDRVEINRRITGRVNKLFGWNLTDTFCGYKRYRSAAMEPELFQELGYAFPLEFWSFCAARGLRIEEIPVERIYVTDDRSFGEDLDVKRKRFTYYLQTLRYARRRFSGSPGSGLGADA